jgi:D-sedoheptulose 7-phosphate isomerase
MSQPIDFSSFMGQYVTDLQAALISLDIRSVAALVSEVRRVRDAGGIIHFIGNGGSAGTPSHSAGDWSKELGVKTIAHTDNIASLTAWANDTAYSNVFVGQLSTFLSAGDLVVGYSGSGNSPNVINGLAYATENGATTVGITGDYNGGGGGKLAGMVDICINCETTSMERIEDLQLIINHIVKEAIKADAQIDGS